MVSIYFVKNIQMILKHTISAWIDSSCYLENEEVGLILTDMKCNTILYVIRLLANWPT